MKALTVRQPWASLIVAGIKDVENRPRRLRYRGRLAIHAGLGVNKDALRKYRHLYDEPLPAGAIIGSVEVVDCVENSKSKWALDGYFHWVLANPRELKRPRPMRGHLGLWDV